MIFHLSQSKIQRSLNFREALQPQSVNKFTLDVCTSSRLLKQSYEFCTQRAETHLLGTTQRALLYEDGNSEIQKIRNLGNKTKNTASHWLCHLARLRNKKD